MQYLYMLVFAMLLTNNFSPGKFFVNCKEFFVSGKGKFSYMSLAIAAELDAFWLAKKVYHLPDGDDFYADVTMIITDSKGEKIERQMKFWRKDYGQDSRLRIEIVSPAFVAGSSFLTWNNANQDNDQWIYLPAFKRVRRIAGSESNNSFMGSDFSYEQLAKRSLHKDDYKILRQEKLDNHDCFVLEAIAKDKEEVIARRVAWVDQQRFLVLKAEFFNQKNEQVKVLTTANIIKIGTIWTVMASTMHDVKKNSRTVLQLTNAKYDTGLADKIFRAENLK